VVTENLMPMLGKKLNEKEKVKWTRIWVAIIGFVAIIIAISAAVIYEVGVVAWTILLVGLFAPFALGMYWKKANSYGAIAAFVGGFSSWLIFYLLARTVGFFGDSTNVICTVDGVVDNSCAFWDAIYIGSFPAFLVSLRLIIVVSLLTQKANPPLPITDIDGKQFDTNPLHNIGWINIKGALKKLKPGEWVD